MKCPKCHSVHGRFKNGRTRKSCLVKKTNRSGGLNPLTVRPKNVKDMLSKYGTQRIVAIKICRQPIISKINWLYETVAPSQVKAVKEKYGYDKFFHLYMILYLEDGTTIRYEKNERVSIKNYIEDDSPKDCKPKTPVTRDITLSQMVDEYEKIGSWKYDVEKNNCQYFVRDNSHILGITQYDTFIKQHLEGVLPKWAKYLADLATNTAALIDYGVHGGMMVVRPPTKIPRPPFNWIEHEHNLGSQFKPRIILN